MLVYVIWACDYFMNKFISTFSLIFLSACQIPLKHELQNISFDVNSVKQIIIQRASHWDLAVRSNDISVIVDLYDVNAHYLPDSEPSIHGNDAISKYWESQLTILQSIELSMESLEGSKELLYETGVGKTVLVDPKGILHTIHFKYVNVWKLNADGKYRVVIDTYNDLANSQMP